jgi:hypothetical protein
MWRLRARHAVPLPSEKAEAGEPAGIVGLERTMSRFALRNVMRGALLRWRRLNEERLRT